MVEPGRGVCYHSRHTVSESSIVVNADGPETRVALIENGILTELFIERDRERSTVGKAQTFPLLIQFKLPLVRA